MAGVIEDPELLRAIEELHQYLSDQLPPLMVSDAIEILVQHPPILMASGIHSWVTSLTRRDTSIPLSDFLYHAVTKIFQMQEYKLVSMEIFVPFLAGLKEAILTFCPPGEQALLRQNLDLLGKATSTGMNTAGSMIRPKGSEPPAVASSQASQGDAGQQGKEERKFGVLLNRLAKKLSGFVTGGSEEKSGAAPAVPGAPVPAPALVNIAQREEAVTAALADAARTAKENSELNKVIDHLRQLGVQTGPDDLFRALGKSLPGWSLPEKAEAQMPENSNLQAMHRIISKAPNPMEATNHFRHLLKAAIERFNDGFLPQASSMFDLANKIVANKEIDVKAIEILIVKGHDNLSEDKLRKYSDNPEQHSLLRKVLSFFPAMSSQGLLEAIYDCPKREKRKLLLTLLECHGEPTRTAALEYLKKPLPKDAPDIEAWYRRNLIYLLRRIPMPANEPLEQTVATVLPYAELRMLSPVVKETLAYLPQLRHEKVEQFVRRMLPLLEAMMAKPEMAPYEPKDIQQIADRVVSCLCRLGTQSARRAVLEHVFKKKPDNDALLRLAELSNADLSDDSQTMDSLLEVMQANLPLKRLGIVIPQKDFIVKCVASAFGGTPHQKARAALEDLVQKYPECQSGRAAAEALQKQEQIKTAKRVDTRAASLMGDLEVFSLPGLLQSLADTAVTGVLTLKNTKGDVIGTITFIKGRLKDSRCGMLTSEAAFYQLFEKPQPGTFQFVRALEATSGTEEEYPEILGIMLEALRRYDEVQQMRAIVPDDIRLKIKAVKPSMLPGERDGLLFRDLWTAVQNGATPVECERTIALDCYRVRRLLSHWMESGVIEAG